MNRRHLVALTFATLIGCATGASLPAVSAQFRPNPTAPRFDQFCERVAVGLESDAVKQRGTEGFELVSLTSFPTGKPVACYKRPAGG